MASVLAIIDGVRDAKMGKPPYFWAVIVSPGHRKELIKDAWKSIWKAFIVAMPLEVTYQVMTHRSDFRGYFLVAAFVLAIFPYLLLRGPINRLAHLLQKKRRWNIDAAGLIKNSDQSRSGQVRRARMCSRWWCAGKHDASN